MCNFLETVENVCSVTVRNMVQQINYVTKPLESVNVGRDIQAINVMNVRYETNLDLLVNHHLHDF